MPLVTVTGNVTDITGEVDPDPLQFFSPEVRDGVLSTKRKQVVPNAATGAFSVQMQAGPAAVLVRGKKYSFNAASGDLLALIKVGLAIPADTATSRLQAAVDAWATAFADARYARSDTTAAGLADRFTKSQADTRFAPVAHTHPTTAVVDLAEYIQDTVAALLKAGTNVTTSYDDAANTFTINATGGGAGSGTDPEVVRDTIGGALVAGSGVTINVDDPGDTITIAVAGIPQSAVTGLSTILTNLRTDLDARYTNQQISDALAEKANAQQFSQLLDNDFLRKNRQGVANGVATLDADGKLTSAQRPAGSGGTDARFSTPQAFTIGDGVTLGPYNLTHNGNSRASFVSVRQKKAPFKEIRLVDVAHPSLSALQIITDKALPVCEVDVVLILGTTDATMPSTATVSFVSKTDTQVVLSATATDNVAVDYFNWFRDGLFIGTSPAGQNYTDTGRAPSTQYSYTATAVDTSGNESATQSAAVQVTTNVSTTPPGFDTSQFVSGNGNQSVNYAVPAGANRPVYALVSHINSGATGSSASVTIGGVAATLVDYKGSNGQAWVGVYKRDNVPAGASVTVAMTTSENYSSLLAFSYAPVASTTVLAGVGGGGTTASSPSTAVAGNERLVSCYSTRENPTVTAGTLRASGNHTSGFQFIRVVEGAGASPQQNTVTMLASAAYACVNFKIAA